MDIYIVNDHNNDPIAAFLSDNKEKVEIALAGMNENWVSIEKIEPNSKLGVNGLVFLLTSKEKSCERGIGQSSKTYRKWFRGN